MSGNFTIVTLNSYTRVVVANHAKPPRSVEPDFVPLIKKQVSTLDLAIDLVNT